MQAQAMDKNILRSRQAKAATKSVKLDPRKQIRLISARKVERMTVAQFFIRYFSRDLLLMVLAGTFMIFMVPSNTSAIITYVDSSDYTEKDQLISLLTNLVPWLILVVISWLLNIGLNKHSRMNWLATICVWIWKIVSFVLISRIILMFFAANWDRVNDSNIVELLEAKDFINFFNNYLDLFYQSMLVSTILYSFQNAVIYSMWIPRSDAGFLKESEDIKEVYKKEEDAEDAEIEYIYEQFSNEENDDELDSEFDDDLNDNEDKLEEKKIFATEFMEIKLDDLADKKSVFIEIKSAPSKNSTNVIGTFLGIVAFIGIFTIGTLIMDFQEISPFILPYIFIFVPLFSVITKINTLKSIAEQGFLILFTIFFLNYPDFQINLKILYFIAILTSGIMLFYTESSEDRKFFGFIEITCIYIAFLLLIPEAVIANNNLNNIFFQLFPIITGFMQLVLDILNKKNCQKQIAERRDASEYLSKIEEFLYTKLNISEVKKFEHKNLGCIIAIELLFSCIFSEIFDGIFIFNLFLVTIAIFSILFKSEIISNIVVGTVFFPILLLISDFNSGTFFNLAHISSYFIIGITVFIFLKRKLNPVLPYLYSSIFITIFNGMIEISLNYALLENIKKISPFIPLGYVITSLIVILINLAKKGVR